MARCYGVRRRLLARRRAVSAIIRMIEAFMFCLIALASSEFHEVAMRQKLYRRSFI